MKVWLNYLVAALMLVIGNSCCPVKRLKVMSVAREAIPCENSSFRIMSFNIRYNNPEDGINAWPNRKNMVASVIRFHQGALVGLQEALKEQINDLEVILADYGWFGVGRDDGYEAGEFAAIFYRKDRFEVQQQHSFWLSETPEIKGSLGWDAACVRIVTWAKFKDLRSGKIFYMFNTHFDHIGALARQKSAELLLVKITEIAGSKPVLVTGDFNFAETSSLYQLLTDSLTALPAMKKLFDARYRSIQRHHGPTWSFHGFKKDFQGDKIDYIFCNEKITVLQHGVLSDKWNDRYPSDHFPVLAEVCIQ